MEKKAKIKVKTDKERLRKLFLQIFLIYLICLFFDSIITYSFIALDNYNTGRELNDIARAYMEKYGVGLGILLYDLNRVIVCGVITIIGYNLFALGFVWSFVLIYMALLHILGGLSWFGIRWIDLFLFYY